MPKPLRSPRGERDRNEVVLRPLRPNLGIEADYRARLRKMVEAMHKSVLYWVECSFHQNEPIMAQDKSSPAIALREAVRNLSRRWTRNFNRMAPKLARYFALAAADRTDANMKAILKAGGIAVEFKMTPAARDVLQATIGANIALIKSIPQQYLGQVQQLVMQSVQTGRDLEQLTKSLQEQFGVTKKRAALIARDQNNKATSAMHEARRKELGIKEGIWLHSHAGKKPRPKHLAVHGKRYDVGKGLKVGDKGDWVLPGQEINCRCTSRSIVTGFS